MAPRALSEYPRFVRLGATLVGTDNTSLGNCLLADLSAVGARLIVQSPADLPDEFSLILSRDGQLRRKCTVDWRSEKAVGVRFILAPGKPART
jgi:PilZ domain